MKRVILGIEKCAKLNLVLNLKFPVSLLPGRRPANSATMPITLKWSGFSGRNPLATFSLLSGVVFSLELFRRFIARTGVSLHPVVIKTLISILKSSGKMH